MNAVQQLLTDHIDIWTAAETEKRSGRGRASSSSARVYGIVKLRELILTLAVRGKLIPQNPSDEPASSLIQEIQIHKAKLISEGRISKEKQLAAITESEKSFNLPSGWEWVRLCDYATDIATGPFGSMIHQSDYVQGGVPLINPSHMVNDTIIPDESISVTHDMAKTLGAYAIYDGDIVMARRGEVGRIALVTKNENGWLCGTGSFVLRFYKEIPRSYLRLLFRSESVRSFLVGESVGTTMVNLNHGILKKMPIGIPPLAEQHRIVAKVDKLMALCDQLEAQHSDAADAHEQLVSYLLGTLTQSQSAADFNANWQRIAAHFDTLFTTEASIDALKQTLLQLAVMGKLVAQDANDESANELLKRIQAEKTKLIAEGKIKKDKPFGPISNAEIPFDLPPRWSWVRFGEICTIKSELVRPEDFQDFRQIGPDCIEKGTGIVIESRTVREAGITGPNSRFYSGQIVYSKIRPSLSKAILVDFDGLCSADMYPIDSFINSEFLLKQILSECFLEQVRVAENRIKMPKLNQESLTAFIIALPPLAEQIRVTKKIDELIVLCDRLKSRISDKNRHQKQLADVLVEHDAIG